MKKNRQKRTLAIVKNSDFLDDCIFTSFDLAQIKKIKKIDSCAKVGLIIKSLLKNIDIFSEDIEVLSAHYSLVRKDFVNSPKKMVKRYMSGL